MIWDHNYYRKHPRIATSIGDILICQEFSNIDAEGKNIDNLGIRTGQAMFSWMRKSTSNSEHASIVTTGWAVNDPVGFVCDANVTEGKDGVAIRPWKPREAYVYRCNNAWLSAEASRVAQNIAAKIRGKNGFYDLKKAVKSVFKFKYVDKYTIKYINNCYYYVYGESRDRTFPGMFCSEFAVLCYILALRRLGISPGNLNVDPRAISVKALQSLLERNASFSRAGRV